MDAEGNQGISNKQLALTLDMFEFENDIYFKV
jgi:hypothetical protein